MTGGFADAAQRGNIGGDAAGAYKTTVRDAGDNLGQRGFAGARRTEKDQVGEAVGLNHPAQQFPGAEQMILPENLLQPFRAHARSQRWRRTGVFRVAGRIVRRGE